MTKPETKPEDKKDAPQHDELTFNTMPNMLTMVRILFVPLVVGMMFMHSSAWDIAATVLFVLASLTDYLDGYLARSRNVVTIYGKLLDPLADKFLVVSTLIMLQELGRIHPIVVMLLICREMAITGLRALASAEGLIIAASGGAKWKTALQMTAIPMLMLPPPGFWGVPVNALGNILIYVSLGLSIWSAKDYIVDFFKALHRSRKQKAELRAQKKRLKQEAKAARKAMKAARRESRLAAKLAKFTLKKQKNQP